MHLETNLLNSLRAKYPQLFTAQLFVIDDEPIVTDLIELLLTRLGFESIHVFNNSVDAFETLKFAKVDLILTDLNMPELGGNYLTRLVRSNERLAGVPVVAFTSDRKKSTEKRFHLSGANELIYKPIDSKQLFEIVVKVLSTRLQKMHIEEQVKCLKENHFRELNELIRERESGLRKVCGRN